MADRGTIDPTLRAGLPLKLGQGNESQPVMADLQG
jgi:hypothetical protein